MSDDAATKGDANGESNEGRREARHRLELVREALVQQLAEVDRLLTESTAEGADAPLRAPCRFCGKMIRSAATTCGFCWRKLAPADAHGS